MSNEKLFFYFFIFWVNQSTSNYLQIEVEPMFDVARHSFFLFSFQILIACTFSCDKSMSQRSSLQSTNAHFLYPKWRKPKSLYIIIQPNFEDPATEKGDLARRLKFAIHLKHRSV